MKNISIHLDCRILRYDQDLYLPVQTVQGLVALLKVLLYNHKIYTTYKRVDTIA